MNTIIHLSAEDVARLAEEFTAAAERGRTARVAIDGGFKVSIGHGCWSPPMGDEKAAE